MTNLVYDRVTLPAFGSAFKLDRNVSPKMKVNPFQCSAIFSENEFQTSITRSRYNM